MDYALLCAGSSFTVGVAEEEHDTALTHVMTDAPEGTHKMVEATTHHQSPKSHNMPTEPVSAKPGSARIMSATPESPAKMATKPADAPLRPGLIACVLDAPLVSVRAAGIPRAAALTIPESRPVRVNLLESSHVSADNPEPLHVSAVHAGSAPEPAPSQELAGSAPEPAPSQELAGSAPEPAPSQELAGSALEAAPSQELAGSTLEAALIQELTVTPRLRRPASHPTPPPTCQSHPTPPPTCQSHPTPPPTCQSHLTPPPTCQSLVTPQQFTQCHFTSLLSLPPRPGGLLSHWPHMDLALHSLPRFHLRSTALLDCAVCVKHLEAALWGGLCHESGCHSPHYSCTSPMDYNSHHSLHYDTHIPIHHCTNHTADCFTTPAPHSHTHI